MGIARICQIAPDRTICQLTPDRTQLTGPWACPDDSIPPSGVVIPPETEKPVLTKAWFKKVTGLSPSSISRMMKAAGVSRARRGGKDHQWTERQARKFLRYVIAHAQDKKASEGAESALREITI